MREQKHIEIGTWLKRRNNGASTRGTESLLVVVADNKERGEYQVGRVDSYSFDAEGRCCPMFGRETWVRYETIQDARYTVVPEPRPPAAPKPPPEPAMYEGPVTLDAMTALLTTSIAETRALRAQVESLTAAVSALHPSVQTALPFRPPPVVAVRKAS